MDVSETARLDSSAISYFSFEGLSSLKSLYCSALFLELLLLIEPLLIDGPEKGGQLFDSVLVDLLE